MFKKIYYLITLIAVAISLSGILWAEDRVGEGATDIAKGATSIPSEIAKTSNESNIIAGVVMGTAKGVVGTIEGVSKGIYQIITFGGDPNKCE